jgi:HD superfamily phosphodiesterase
MKIISTAIVLMNLINSSFKYVIETSKTFNIDESHALKHSMEVLGYAKKIYESEVKTKPYLENQKKIIYMAAIGHDMCDKKYMDEKEGIIRYKNYLNDLMTPNDLEVMGKIIETMSYSKVKVNGFPDLGEYQLAYHIVREADLLAAYDLDRCIIYKIYHNNYNYSEAIEDAFNLFENRVFKMRKDKLFKTDYSKKESLKLHKKAIKDVLNLKTLYD